MNLAPAGVRNSALSALDSVRLLRGAILVGFIIRLAWALAAPVEPVSDFRWYFDHASSLAAGSGYISADGTPTAYFPVGYPAFLASVFGLFGHSVLAAKLANVVLSTLTIWVVFGLFGRMLGKRFPDRDRTRTWATLLVMLLPSQILYVSLVSDSILFQLLLCAGVWLLLDRQPQHAVLGGLVLGLATLTRPYALLMPVVVIALTVGLEWRHRLQQMALAYVALVAVVLPWSIRNHEAMGGVVPVSTNGGINLLIGNGHGATGGYTILPLAPVEAAGLPELESDRLARRLALDAMGEDPLRVVGLVPRKLFHLFGDDAQALRWNLKGSRVRGTREGYSDGELAAMGVVQLAYSVVLLLAIGFMVAVLAGRTRVRDMSWVGLAIMLTFAGVASVFFGSPRFHFPLVPFMCLYAAGAMTWLDRRRRSRGAGAPARAEAS